MRSKGRDTVNKSINTPIYAISTLTINHNIHMFVKDIIMLL